VNDPMMAIITESKINGRFQLISKIIPIYYRVMIPPFV
jgi:hypothetical protein